MGPNIGFCHPVSIVQNCTVSDRCLLYAGVRGSLYLVPGTGREMVLWKWSVGVTGVPLNSWLVGTVSEKAIWLCLDAIRSAARVTVVE